MKDKKTQSQVPKAPIPVSNTKLQSEIDRESDITIKELQLKEKLLQQNAEMNKCKANELCYVFQNDYHENKKDEGNDMQNMRFYMETLASNIEKHITCKEDLMLNEIETKKTILLQIEKFKYQQISYTERFTTTELIKSLEEKGPDPNSPDTDVYIKFSVLLQKENCLSDFLGDILQNMNKRRPIWSESTVNLYSLLLNYGGPVAVDLMRRNLGGPSLSRVYLQARQTIPIETSLTETSFRNAAEFYKKVCKDVDIKSIIFTIAVDATPVLPLIRAKGNKLLGFATNKDIIVQSAEDVIQVFKDDSLLRAQQTYVFALVPLRSDIPYCILAAPPVVKGENQGTALNWLIKSKEWGQQYNLNIYGLGADGDSKIRSFYVHRYLKNHGCNDFTIDRQDFTFSLPQNQFDSIDCPFPDPRHLLKKWRNQLLNIRRLLIMGDHLVQLEHLMELADIEELKHTLGLWKTDIRVNDKQNVNAAIRLFNPNVQSHLKEYGSR
ncbi:unnamed protein product [Mytilus edulis]|uniref:Uncharacterized protein n=1 Tax=Mytilus edulis TaxID=6550 RepID=A0A8S3RGM8_MYTED|nr:unnamed protein product [Mytilus edulis]